MEKYHIKLTKEEAELLSKIDLRSHHPHHDDGRAAYLNNQEPILALLKLLSARNAVPEVRLSYWNDPNYRTGRVKGSRKGLLNGMDAPAPISTRILISLSICVIFCSGPNCRSPLSKSLRRRWATLNGFLRATSFRSAKQRVS